MQILLIINLSQGVTESVTVSRFLYLQPVKPLGVWEVLNEKETK